MEIFIYQNGLVFIIIIRIICGSFKEVDNFLQIAVGNINVQSLSGKKLSIPIQKIWK